VNPGASALELLEVVIDQIVKHQDSQHGDQIEAIMDRILSLQSMTMVMDVANKAECTSPEVKLPK